jgi:hypothetical protein
VHSGGDGDDWCGLAGVGQQALLHIPRLQGHGGCMRIVLFWCECTLFLNPNPENRPPVVGRCRTASEAPRG